MKNQENEANQQKEKENFLRIFPNIKRCKALDWEERAILSNYISFLIQGKEFYQTDSFQAKELGLSPAQVSKYTGRLKERGIIDTKLDYEENTNGGRPIPVRYVTVIEMDKWTKGDAVPQVKKIISPAQKKKAIQLANKNAKVKTDNKISAESNTVDLKQTNPSATQTSQLKEKAVAAEQKTMFTSPVSITLNQEKASSNKIEDLIEIVKLESFSLPRENDLVKAILCGKIVSENHLQEIIATMK